MEKIVLDNASDDKIGDWDKVAIAYGYTHFEEGRNEAEELDKIIQNSLKEGLSFLSDQDARPLGSAHPKAHLWDNGEESYLELNRMMEIRKVALANFGEKNIPAGTPFAELEEVLVPM